jgi:hypothetical protein
VVVRVGVATVTLICGKPPTGAVRCMLDLRRVEEIFSMIKPWLDEECDMVESLMKH